MATSNSTPIYTTLTDVIATMSAAPLRPSKHRVLNGLKMLQFQSPCALRSMIDLLLSARKLVVKPRDIRADPKSPTHASGGSALGSGGNPATRNPKASV